MISRRSRCSPSSSRDSACAEPCREVALQFARQVRIVGQVGQQQVIAEPDLAVGEHHRELGAREALAGACAVPRPPRRSAGTRSRGRARRRAPASGSGAGIRRGAPGALLAAGRSPGSAGSCCAAPAAPTSSVMLREQLVALARGVCLARRATTSSRILMFTSTSEVLTPAELSMKSVLMRPPLQRELDAPDAACSRGCRLRRSPCAQLASVDADRVVGAVADLRVASDAFT